MDRLLALQLGLRYRQVLTVARVRGIIIISWLVLTSLGMLYYWNMRSFLFILGISALLCLVISTVCYMKIILTLRQRQTKISQQNQTAKTNSFIPAHVLRYKKTVSSLMWVSLAMISFYLPITSVITVRFIYGASSPVVLAQGVSTTVVHFNSSLNPVIYCWKIREVRQAVKKTITRFCSLCF